MPVDTAPVPNQVPQDTSSPQGVTRTVPDLRPTVTDPKGGTTGSTVGGAIPNPNLNPKVVSSYPQPNTATITNPNATFPKPTSSPSQGTGTTTNPNLKSPNLQTGSVPKINTNLGTANAPNATSPKSPQTKS